MVSAMKHTLGRWFHRAGAVGGTFSVWSDTPEAEGSVCVIHGSRGQGEANAHLVASAPELLAVLEAVATQVTYEAGGMSKEMLTLMHEASTVIAKARGNR